MPVMDSVIDFKLDDADVSFGIIGYGNAKNAFNKNIRYKVNVEVKEDGIIDFSREDIVSISEVNCLFEALNKVLGAEREIYAITGFMNENMSFAFSTSSRREYCAEAEWKIYINTGAVQNNAISLHLTHADIVRLKEYLFEICEEPALSVDRAAIHNNRISTSNSNREQSHIMYLAEADAQLRTKCVEILREIYGDDSIPDEVMGRVLEELTLVKGKNDSTKLLYLWMLFTKYEWNTNSILVKGHINSLYIAFLLGLTAVNPIESNIDIDVDYRFDEAIKLELRLQMPYAFKENLKEMLMTLDGVKEVYQVRDLVTSKCSADSDFVVYLLKPEGIEIPGKKIGDSIIIGDELAFQYLKDYVVIEVRHCKEMSMLHDLYKYTGFNLLDEGTTDINVIRCVNDNFLKKRKTNDAILPCAIQEDMRDVMKKLKPCDFEELIRVIGLARGIDTWKANAFLRVCDGTSIQDVITSTEDIYDHLVRHNVGEDDAYKVTKYFSKGKARYIVMNKYVSEWKEIEQILTDNNIDCCFIESCKRIVRTQSVGHIAAYAMILVKLGFFKIHYEGLYADIYHKYYDSEKQVSK